MRRILCDFFLLLRVSFFQGRAARNLCCQMQQYLCYGGGLTPSLSATSCYHATLPNCQTLKTCRCRPVVLEAALFSASEVGVAWLSTHPQQPCEGSCAITLPQCDSIVVWSRLLTLCMAVYGQSPCDESFV